MSVPSLRRTRDESNALSQETQSIVTLLDTQLASLPADILRSLLRTAGLLHPDIAVLIQNTHHHTNNESHHIAQRQRIEATTTTTTTLSPNISFDRYYYEVQNACKLYVTTDDDDDPDAMAENAQDEIAKPMNSIVETLPPNANYETKKAAFITLRNIAARLIQYFDYDEKEDDFYADEVETWLSSDGLMEKCMLAVITLFSSDELGVLRDEDGFMLMWQRLESIGGRVYRQLDSVSNILRGG